MSDKEYIQNRENKAFVDSYNAVFKAANLKHRYTKPKGIAYYKINDPLPAQYWVGGVYDAFITEDKDEVN